MALTFSITGGADAAKFTIGASTGVLAFKTAPDFEAPGDADTNNIYVVEVGVSDGTSTTKQTINVTVTDVVENLPPQITSPATAAVKEGDTAVMTVTATDPDETTPPPVTGTIPLSYADARFSGNATLTQNSVPENTTMSNKKYTSLADNAITVWMGGTSGIENCNFNSRECVRIGGAGTFTINNCYLEATGQGADHADTIQCYAPGNRGTVRVTNSSIVAHNTAATAGLFCADNWTGTFDLENVVFNGGPYGLRLHADTGGDNIVKLKNVFFVGPFGAGPFYFVDWGGHTNVIQLWENVRWATISGGVLVPGAVIPRP